MFAAGVSATVVPKAFGGLEMAESNAVTLPPQRAPIVEAKEVDPSPALAPRQRIGFAIVGLGQIAIDQVLPAFAQSKYARPVALVSGHRPKAEKIAAQYGIPPAAIFDYASFERLAEIPEVQVIYIALPNSLHAEYTIRAAKIGKHVLCEKPMAVTVAEGEQMAEACEKAGVKLMIAYRSQYEPMDRALEKLIREGVIGKPLHFVASNTQDMGDPGQWRLKQDLAGGGPLVDVGIYCLNAARFLSGEEPYEVTGQTSRLPEDPRFHEVESSAQFMLQFPSGLSAACNCSYDSHRSQFFRLEGSAGWAEMSPAFAYKGLKLRYGRTVDGTDVVTDVNIEAKDQFALELDHMAECVVEGRTPLTPGAEGIQDLRIITAIYDAARSGQTIPIKPVSATRGPALKQEA